MRKQQEVKAKHAHAIGVQVQDRAGPPFGVVLDCCTRAGAFAAEGRRPAGHHTARARGDSIVRPSDAKTRE